MDRAFLLYLLDLDQSPLNEHKDVTGFSVNLLNASNSLSFGGFYRYFDILKNGSVMNLSLLLDEIDIHIIDNDDFNKFAEMIRSGFDKQDELIFSMIGIETYRLFIDELNNKLSAFATNGNTFDVLGLIVYLKFPECEPIWKKYKLLTMFPLR